MKSLTQNEVLATWSNGFGHFFNKTLNLEKWEPNFNTQDNVFVASTFHCPPFVYCKETTPYDGVDYRIFKEITKLWPTKVTCQHSDEEDIYAVIVNNTIKGISDVSFCSLWTATVNSEPVKLTTPYVQICASFLVPKPSLLPKSSFVFQPFQLELWCFYTFILLLTSIIFYITDLFYEKVAKIRYFSGFVHSFLETLRVLTLGSSKRSPKQRQHIFRVILIFWWYCALLLSTAYSAGITSALTTPRYTKPINTLQDMADNKIKWGDNTGGMQTYYSQSTDNVIREIANNYVHEDNIQAKLERLKENNYGTFVKLLPEKYVTDTEQLDDYAKSNLKTLSACIAEYSTVFALQKNSNYIKIFDHGIQALLENGLISYWYKKIRYKYGLQYLENFYSLNLEKKNLPLNFERLLGLLYLLILGNLIGFVIFIAELCLKRFYYKNL